MDKKKEYEQAELKIVRFDVSDIITTSNPQIGESTNDDSGWTTPKDYWS
ncbi:MAG: hypothetical protein IKJ13_05720 [Clostridia bacterium]|nr:hypothetical protein [Clostridia bacterium]